MKVHTEGRPDSCTAIFLYTNAMKHFITIIIGIQGAECVPRTLFQPLGVRIVAPASISLAADIVGSVSSLKSGTCCQGMFLVTQETSASQVAKKPE